MELCELVQPSAVPQLAQPKYNMIFGKLNLRLGKEFSEYPAEVQNACYIRESKIQTDNIKNSSGDASSVIRTFISFIMPFGGEEGGEFKALSPTLSSLTLTMNQKLSRYMQVTFKQTLAPLLLQGLPKAPLVKSFCELFAEEFSKVDLLELNNAAAGILRESDSVLKVLIAVLTPEDDFETEVEDEFINLFKMIKQRAKEKSSNL